MKNLAHLKLFIISIIFSFSCHADWVKFGKSDKGNTFYVDLERIKKHEGYIYWWQLIDKEHGSSSVKFYIQADCKKFRVKILSVYNYREPMGRGGVVSIKPPKEWSYPPFNTPGEESLIAVCGYTKKQ